MIVKMLKYVDDPCFGQKYEQIKQCEKCWIKKSCLIRFRKMKMKKNERGRKEVNVKLQVKTNLNNEDLEEYFYNTLDPKIVNIEEIDIEKIEENPDIEMV